jgi:hypothetical protein
VLNGPRAVPLTGSSITYPSRSGPRKLRPATASGPCGCPPGRDHAHVPRDTVLRSVGGWPGRSGAGVGRAGRGAGRAGHAGCRAAGGRQSLAAAARRGAISRARHRQPDPRRLAASHGPGAGTRRVLGRRRRADHGRRHGPLPAATDRPPPPDLAAPVLTSRRDAFLAAALSQLHP